MRLHAATIFLIGAFVAELAIPIAAPAAVADNERTIALPTMAPSATVSFRPEEFDQRFRLAQQGSGTAEPAGSAVGDPAVAERKAARAKKQLELALRLQAKLENMGVRIWGVDVLVTNYAGALKTLVEGDAHFSNGDFDRAAAAYRHAEERFERLQAGRPKRLARALEKGRAALDRLDDVIATHYFEIALAAEPGNAAAESGLKRAQDLPLAVERFERARRLETSGELDGAARAYREVESLDGAFPGLRAARTSLDRRIEERDYRRAVSGALIALEQRDYARAWAALGTARRLRPEAPEAREVEARIGAAKIRDRLDRLRRRASTHERNEDWAALLEVYGEALAIDPHVGFAVVGKPRAERFLELNRQLDYYLAQPDRLHSPKPRAHARDVLAIVGQADDAAPGMSRKARKLDALIASAVDPRPVVLRSDEATDVVIHRVARLGRFRERRLRLRPGAYTAIGSRAGYRDVRIQFHVRPSTRTIVVDVRCEERI